MENRYKCPHCGGENVINESSWDEELMANIPKSIFRAILITAAGAVTGGLGGLAVAGLFYGKSVKKYLDGIEITCGNCGKVFRA